MDNEEQTPIEEQLPQDLALNEDEEEGINIELGKLPPYLGDSSDDGQSSNADNEETAEDMLAAQSSSAKRPSRRNLARCRPWVVYYILLATE